MTFVRPVEAALRVLERTEVNGLYECWPFRGALSREGYGCISDGNRQRGAHRVMYEALVGPVPEGLELDHVREWGCTMRSCVNPRHLEPVTQQENIARIPRVRTGERRHPPTTLGENLRRIRLESKTNQSALANRAGLGLLIIGHIETGLVTRPSARTIGKLAVALGVEPHQLTGVVA